MVPALIFAALTALLLCATTSLARSLHVRNELVRHGLALSAEIMVTAGNHVWSTTLALSPIGASSTSARTPSGKRKTVLTDQIPEVDLTSINFCKFLPGLRQTFRMPQHISLAEDSIRPVG